VYGGPGAVLKKEKDITTQTSFSTETTNRLQKSAFGPTFIFALGVDIRITKNLFVDLNWRYDLEVHFPVAGLAIKIK
jgi:opacity protein-like surface antigen